MRSLSMALAGALLLAGCGGGSATVTPKMLKTGGARRVGVEMLRSPFQRWIEPATTTTRYADRTPILGSTTADSITSLQYYIQSIQLCQSVTVVGTGYSGTSGCSALYTNPAAQAVSLYNTYTITEASTDTDPTHFIDFLNPSSVSVLEQPTTIAAGTYNYALINFMRPIKMTAEFKDGSGTTVAYTKTGAIVAGATDSAGRENEYLRPTTTNTGPAELMTYMLPNGGTLFPFIQPFVVAAGDSVFVDFVFNPANFASMNNLSATPGTAPVFDTTNQFTFDLPYAKMAPVVRKAGESTRKEIYRVAYDTGAKLSNLRIELYYNDADATKAIRGVDVALEMDPTATDSSINIVSAMKATETAEGVSLIGYNQASGQIDGVSLSGLARRADSTVTLNCLFNGGPCTALTDTFSKAATYVGDSAL